MSDVFISYARSSAAEATAMDEALQAHGYTVWRDVELPAHRVYGDVIEEQLRLARAVVVIWSAEAVRSQWVRSEADLARGDSKLVQVALDASRLPMPFDQIQCADLTGWSGDAQHPAWQKTLASIATLVGAPGAAGDVAAPPEPARGNLPRAQSALIGRGEELAQIGRLLEASDLVTITGTGGVGKTRIALEFAHAHADAHEDGAWLVELAAVTEPGEVPLAIGRTFGIQLTPGPGALAALMARLRPRHCLIVLDNCEHVVDAVAALAEAVLEHTKDVKLLASSQEPLGVEGERVFRLKSLGEADAAALFVERARGADAAWTPRGGDDAAIATICQRLDGIPLALEMAAARAPALGCEAVLKRLDDRFRILTGGRRTALPRQRTLQATLDWSHGLLSPTDAAVFRRLGVFTAGFTLEAAAKVAAGGSLDEVEVIDAVASLVAKSLVLADADGGGTRYRLLETTRMYALERLADAGETVATQKRHASWFAAFWSASGEHYCTLSDEGFYDRYVPDMANIEKALAWAFGPDGDSEIGIALAAGAYPVWAAQGAFLPFLPWCDLALARCGPRTPPDAVVELKRFCVSCFSGMRPSAASRMGEEILPAVRAREMTWWNENSLLDLLINLGNALRLQGREVEARPYVEEAAQMAATLPANRLTVGARFLQLYSDLSDIRAIASGLLDAERQARDIGADGWATIALRDRAVLFDVSDGDAEIAETRRAMDTIRPKHMFAGQNVAFLSYILAERLARRNASGDLDEAWALVRGSEKFYGRYIPARFYYSFVQLAVSDGRAADAARLLGIGIAAAASVGVNFAGSQAVEARARALLAPHLNAEELTALIAEGQRFTLEQAYDLAMKRSGGPTNPRS